MLWNWTWWFSHLYISQPQSFETPACSHPSEAQICTKLCWFGFFLSVFLPALSIWWSRTENSTRRSSCSSPDWDRLRTDWSFARSLIAGGPPVAWRARQARERDGKSWGPGSPFRVHSRGGERINSTAPEDLGSSRADVLTRSQWGYCDVYLIQASQVFSWHVKKRNWGK